MRTFGYFILLIILLISEISSSEKLNIGQFYLTYLDNSNFTFNGQRLYLDGFNVNVCYIHKEYLGSEIHTELDTNLLHILIIAQNAGMKEYPLDMAVKEIKKDYFKWVTDSTVRILPFEEKKIAIKKGCIIIHTKDSADLYIRGKRNIEIINSNISYETEYYLCNIKNDTLLKFCANFDNEIEMNNHIEAIFDIYAFFSAEDNRRRLKKNKVLLILYCILFSLSVPLVILFSGRE
jgi:hypothetical protein